MVGTPREMRVRCGSISSPAALAMGVDCVVAAVWVCSAGAPVADSVTVGSLGVVAVGEGSSVSVGRGAVSVGVGDSGVSVGIGEEVDVGVRVGRMVRPEV